MKASVPNPSNAQSQPDRRRSLGGHHAAVRMTRDNLSLPKASRDVWQSNVRKSFLSAAIGLPGRES
jgi:hypothetical protein